MPRIVAFGVAAITCLGGCGAQQWLVWAQPDRTLADALFFEFPYPWAVALLGTMALAEHLNRWLGSASPRSARQGQDGR